MCDKIPFFTFFESFVPPRELGLLLHDACVVGGSMDRAQRTMELELTASAPLPEAAVIALRQLLMDQYDLRQLRLSFRTPQRADDRSDVLMGRENQGQARLHRRPEPQNGRRGDRGQGLCRRVL